MLKYQSASISLAYPFSGRKATITTITTYLIMIPIWDLNLSFSSVVTSKCLRLNDVLKIGITIEVYGSMKTFTMIKWI